MVLSNRLAAALRSILDERRAAVKTAVGLTHGQLVCTLNDGRWWDGAQGVWRSGKGRVLRREVSITAELLTNVRTTRVILATAHRDHDPTNNRFHNLSALCQRCHLALDSEEHKRRRWFTLFRLRALGDPFLGPYR
jgi:hypothetical protein